MAEYIEREALAEEIKYLRMTITGLRAGKGVLAEYVSHYRDSILRTIDEQPTVDAVPVVHGRWIHDINNLYGCSVCMERETMSPKKLKPYCPNCGAKMDATDINVGDKEG